MLNNLVEDPDTSTLDLIAFRDDRTMLQEQIADLLIAFQKKYHVQVSQIEWSIMSEQTICGAIKWCEARIKCEI